MDVFIEMLKQAIDNVEREDNSLEGSISLCGLRLVLLEFLYFEGFEKYLSDNQDIKLKYELKAAYSGLVGIKDEVIDKNDIDKLADMFISAGFDLFFDKDLMGKFKLKEFLKI